MTSAKWISNLFNSGRITAERRLVGGQMSRRQSPRVSAPPRLEALEDRFVPAPLMVTSAADSGTGTLRAALTTANQTTGLVTINFAIGVSGTSQTINLISALPAISATVLLDGTSQGGSSYSGPQLIELNGAAVVGSASGLVLTGSNSTIKGLIIDHFTQDGILLNGTATGNTIGGISAGSGNVLSGNGNDGIEIAGSGVMNNLVAGNFIGTTATGTSAIANTFDGIHIRSGASANTIGGTTAGASNVVSGNGNDGVEIVNSGTMKNLVLGNFIGTNSSGTKAIANTFDGIHISTGASANSIGGTAIGTGNVISGNSNDGIEIINAGTANNLVQGNFIGTNSSGTAILANTGDGVLLSNGAAGNTIGGTSAGTGNVLSGNGNNGIEIVNAGTMNNLVAGNFIGSNSSGTKAFANTFDGILLSTGPRPTRSAGRRPGLATSFPATATMESRSSTPAP